MIYTGAMVLPQNAIVLHEETMRYVDGGLSLKMTRGYLNKTTCIETGKGIIRTYNWTDTTSQKIAKEIYAHAVLYYASAVASIVTLIMPSLPSCAKASITAGCNWIRSHANPIDIGGDTALRISIFNAIWKVF